MQFGLTIIVRVAVSDVTTPITSSVTVTGSTEFEFEIVMVVVVGFVVVLVLVVGKATKPIL